ncbi:hypothetical protein HS088_TW10G00788 [Tripterygium wilfordii]|uniref:Uncharacterized protein n=1 Tax=Tripterygium wilfordii TaxID=458696 RepID=A0A7J7D635_TRIWF|nr:uncharacterized protein LOC120006990 [Tripterygium wilfordii]XP_038713050.1 uncharacterized protein LOC120006990 [Tripterygium wilfordii]XP_038713052.1 uncharacterized protein LOC120006990 [Tripterygium wilfordii]KAF5741782.1 hypothetical protein HS088_TW10G00788 [Tripterygium wilfordii]
MKPRENVESRAQRAKAIQGDGPNWILVAGGALLSTLSIRLGYKLKQTLDSKQQANSSSSPKGNGISSDRRGPPGFHLHSNMYSFPHDNDGCFHCVSGNESMELKYPPSGQVLSDSDVTLPLVTVPSTEYHKENGVIWASSPDRLELPPKPFHHSNCSDSPCVSESGSDIFIKREVIHKLRQQLKRRDDMILEMQDQIAELQNSLNAQVAHSTHLQSQLDAAHKDLFDSEREIQRLRKAIADHCVGHVGTNGEEKHGNLSEEMVTSMVRVIESLEKGRGDGERIEKLKSIVGELKEVIEGKEYVLQSYKEQKAELSMKIKELQQRLDSRLPNIL